ncbi:MULTISPECIES: restriction endonuclease subunit S [Enterococcus]|uniref:restriction endonuclease subunit S n=1 Tax=Enterococcus TaxID=1350 RepID=UPI001105AB24|nr:MULTISPECIES: restriction endonuclease subunit S [Enterococcus]EGP5535409.1 restriction endonuclease subunit S [Enterococcus faecium]EMF0320586.1 restriction endonuclease subunit S [Enterococcus faecium]MDB1679727.1 restriction endonuclease subunit S [Enterococcus durans]
MSNDTQPEIRFPGFTDDWEQRKLKEFGKSTGGTSIESEFVEGGKYKVISIGSYSEQSVYTDQNIRAELTDKTRNRVLNKGDLTMILNDKTASGNIIGRVLLIDSNDSYVYNQRTERIEPDHKKYDSQFLYHMLNAPMIRSKIIKQAQGNTQIYVNWSAIGELDYLVPNLDEQREIGAFFFNLNNLITLHQRKLDLLKETKKGFLQKMFPKNGAKVPEIRFPGFTEDWEERKLSEMAGFSKGNGYSKADLVEKGHPVILYGRLYTKYETVIEKVDTFAELKEKSVISNGGEVIVPASGETPEDISRASVVDVSGVALGGDLNIIKTKSELNPTFLALTISNGSQQKEMTKRAQGKSVVHLHNSDLKEVNLLCPKLDEQVKIGSFFKKLDVAITLHQRKLDLLKETKKGFLQKMFV